MTKEREALKLALEALEFYYDQHGEESDAKAITAIREALAQPEQEPVAYLDEGLGAFYWAKDYKKHVGFKPLYTTPPQRKPVAHTTGNCENHKQKGGCQLHNLQCGWPDCDRKPITAPPTQRKPLTDEEIILIVADCASSHQHTDIHFARAIETAHGIKE